VAPHTPHTRRGQSIQLLAVHKAQVCRLHHAQKRYHHLFEPLQHTGQFLQPLPTAQFFDVVHNHLYPQNPIPLVIHLEGELAEVHLEHRQVIHRPRNDFLQSPLPCWSLAGTAFATEDGFESGHVQQSARAVNEPLIDFVKLPTAFEQEG